MKNRIPSYFSNDGLNLIPLSSGLDTQTILSMCEEKRRIHTFTYGRKGCNDQIIAKKIADKGKIPHTQIFFDELFELKLSSLFKETVRYSGGRQSVLRSTLLYACQRLYNEIDDDAFIVSGVAGDLYRAIPLSEGGSMVSSGISSFIKKGKIVFEDDHRNLFEESYIKYEDHIKSVFSAMSKNYGDDKVQFRCNFSIFEIYSNYFGGEFSIMDKFFTFRLPFLDRILTDVIFKTTCSKLGNDFEDSCPTNYYKNILQARMISGNGKFKNSWINGMPVNSYAMNDYQLFSILKYFVRSADFLVGRRPSRIKLEDWNFWINRVMERDIQDIFENESYLKKYISSSAIKRILKGEDIVLKSKIVTAEILINLLKNKWNYIN
jgi:hypothetical protein